VVSGKGELWKRVIIFLGSQNSYEVIYGNQLQIQEIKSWGFI
jgi:hypothetical protein